MARKKKIWKAVPHITPFERRSAIEVEKNIKQGFNPLTVSVHSAEGSYRYTYRDVMNYFERSHKPFNLTVSLF
jgi:DUF1365 family protein